VNTAMRLLVLMVVTLLPVALATAQGLPSFDTSDMEYPSNEILPLNATPSRATDSSQNTEQSLVTGPIRSGQAESVCNEDLSAPTAYDLWDMEPVPIESTGTWLRRGLWFAEADAAAMMRQWSRHDMLLASPNGQLPPFANSNIALILRKAHPGRDASVRTTLGRYLFRDEDNRDHTTELTVFIGGDWVQDIGVGSPALGLQVPFQVDGNNTSFDNSTRQTAIYSSRFNSFEWNYHIERRMERDQMVMDPNGQWSRQATPGFTKEFLFGLRYLQLSEILDWEAEDVQLAGNDGKYLIQADNDLFGLQFGLGFTYETARWSIGLNCKGGPFVNDASSHSNLDFSVDDSADFDRRSSEDTLSFIGESSTVVKWHLTPNFSLRTGLSLTYITAVAEAPYQANFIADYNSVVTSGNPFYFGATAGVEGYW
jgi:hypothetical protein